MDWDKLRIFHAVAEAGNLTQAGRNLRLSQSALSRHISTLEHALGVSLFRRHARGLVLSEQGEMLYAATREIFDKLSVIKGKLSDAKQLPEGPLIITVSEFIGATWLIEKLPEFRALSPEIQLTVLFEDRILNLNRKEADAAIRLGKPTEVDLIQRYLTTVHFHICASKSYFKKHGKPNEPGALKNHTLLAFPPNAQMPFLNTNWLLSAANVELRRQSHLMLINSMYGIQKAVTLGAGIALLPDYIISRNPELEVILPELETPKIEMYFVYPQERQHSKRITLFRDFLVQNIEKTTFYGIMEKPTRSTR